jgi:hypothetical protein
MVVGIACYGIGALLLRPVRERRAELGKDGAGGAPAAAEEASTSA